MIFLCFNFSLDVTERMEMLQQSIETIRTNMEAKISVNTNEIEMTRSRINDQMLAVESSLITEMQRQNLDLSVLLKQLQYQIKSSTIRNSSVNEFVDGDEIASLEETARIEASKAFDVGVEHKQRRTTHI